uniref:Uncharacterized protein n=1 Tax=Anguilla anguilla TaxID=7936 RepID=A0A0E9XHV3_ANGAN
MNGKANKNAVKALSEPYAVHTQTQRPLLAMFIRSDYKHCAGRTHTACPAGGAMLHVWQYGSFGEQVGLQFLFQQNKIFKIFLKIKDFPSRQKKDK